MVVVCSKRLHIRDYQGQACRQRERWQGLYAQLQGRMATGIAAGASPRLLPRSSSGSKHAQPALVGLPLPPLRSDRGAHRRR